MGRHVMRGADWVHVIDDRSSRGLFRGYTVADPDGQRRRPWLPQERAARGIEPSFIDSWAPDPQPETVVPDHAARLTARLARTTAGCDALRPCGPPLVAAPARREGTRRKFHTPREG
jgi:hypothetical protein